MCVWDHHGSRHFLHAVKLHPSYNSMRNVFELTWNNCSCKCKLCYTSPVQGKEIPEGWSSHLRDHPVHCNHATNACASSFMTWLLSPNYCGLLVSPRCEIIIALVQGIKMTHQWSGEMHMEWIDARSLGDPSKVLVMLWLTAAHTMYMAVVQEKWDRKG